MNSYILLLAKELDQRVINLLDGVRTASGIKVAIFITNMGSPQVFLLLTVALCLLFWLHKKPNHLIQFLATLGAGFAVMELMKILIARPRPVEALISASGYSMPSGHALISTLFCSMVIYSYKNHFKDKLLRIFFIIFFALSTIAVSLSRVYLAVHYLSDVAVGILLGLLISSISVFVFESFFKKEDLV